MDRQGQLAAYWGLASSRPRTIKASHPVEKSKVRHAADFSFSKKSNIHHYSEILVSFKKTS